MAAKACLLGKMALVQELMEFMPDLKVLIEALKHLVPTASRIFRTSI